MHIAKRRSRSVLLACLLAAMVTFVLAAGDGPVARHVIGADGKRMTIQEGAKILFFDGIGAEAKQLAAVDITGRRATPSRHGTAVALCSQSINETGPVAVYDNTGRKLGQFDVERPWKVAAVSDDGELIAFTQLLSGLSPFVVRLHDLNGALLAEYDKSPTFCAFSPDGIPVVWGAQVKTRKPSISVLDNRGRETRTWQYANQERSVHDLAASEGAAIVAVLNGPQTRSEPPSAITVWRPSTGTRDDIVLPKDQGQAQPGIAIAADGSFVAVQLGATGIALISTTQRSVTWNRDISSIAGEKNTIKAITDIVHVGKEGNVRLQCLLTSGRAILVDMDATGKLLHSENIVN